MKKPRDFDLTNDIRAARKFFPANAVLTCMLFACFVLSGLNASAQVKLSVSLKNVTLQEAFREIGRLTGYDFVYSSNELAGTARITLNATNKDLNEVLADCLRQTKFGYVIDNRNIIISPKVAQPWQKNVLRGVVRDQNGNPLSSVSVTALNSKSGTLTDAQGTFRLGCPADHVTLVFSYVGMETQQVEVSSIARQAAMNISMKQAIMTVREVIVTGYADIRRESFTGSTTTVSKEQMQKVTTSNVLQALQVFDPSFRLETNNLSGSNPNALPEFYIRGRSGLGGLHELDQIGTQTDLSRFALVNNPNLPVFILDGFEVSSEKVYDLDLNTIQSITILKDAAATAIYGSRASNGVIVIETEAPKSGKLRVTYNFTGKVTAPDLTDYHPMNARQKLDAELAAGLLDSTDPIMPNSITYPNRVADYRTKEGNILRGVDTYWLSQPLQTQLNHKHALYIEGGEGSVRFVAGLRYEGEDGVMKESFRDRIGAELKMDYRFKNLVVSNTVSFDNIKNQASSYGVFSDYVKLQPYYSPYDLNTGELLKKLPGYWYDGSGKLNPLYEATLGNYDRGGYFELIDNMNMNWHISDRWLFKAQFSINYKDNHNERFIDPNSMKFDSSSRLPSERGELYLTAMTEQKWDGNALVIYTNTIGGHNINASLGINAQNKLTDYSYSTYRGFPNGTLNTLKYAAHMVAMPVLQDNHTRLAGAFFMGNYTYRDIYLADVSLRYDGSSEFGSKKRYAPFWSTGVGMNIHNLEALKTSEVISKLRVRANYGQTGRVNYPPYAALHTYDNLLGSNGPTGIGAVLYYMGNKYLKWEKANTLNLGFDVSLFHSRLNIEFSWYDKLTKDLIEEITVPVSSGFAKYMDNVGQVDNRGYEFRISGSPVRTQNFDLNLFINAAHNKNKILKISNTLRAYNDRVIAYYQAYNATTSPNPLIASSNLAYSKPLLQYEEGGSSTAIYGIKSLGISPANGRELFVTRNGVVTYDYDPMEQQVIGNREPKLQGSFGFNVRYKRLTLYTTFLFECGGQIYNQTLVDNVENLNIWERNGDTRVLKMRWQKPGDIAPLKSLRDRNFITRPTSRFVQDNNVVSFNSLSLGYDFNPALLDRIGVRMLRLSLLMNDVARFCSVKAERGIGYPFARTFSMTLNLGF